MDNGLSQLQQGELLSDIRYLKECCGTVMKDMDKIRDEQITAKNRTVATLVGVIVTLAFLALTYFR